MESQLATLATDTGTTVAKLFQVERIQTILFKFWAFGVYTLINLTPIRLFCVKGRFSGLSGIKTDNVWPEIRPLGFKGLKVFWYDSTRGSNPGSTDCEADALTITPSHLLY